MSVRHAVVLICDKNFLRPTFATALSARRNLTRDDVIVRILVVDADAAWCARFDKVGQEERISILPAPVPEIEELKKYHRDRYLPVVALSRFWVDRFLEPEIERFLYLDGDTLVDGNIDQIFDADLPAGGILAVSDTVNLCLKQLGGGAKREKAYLAGLGVAEGDYFNSGVILACNKGWREFSDKAVKFFVEHSDLCRSSDQSALNAVAGKLRGKLSLRWNYQSDHMTIFDPRTVGIKPLIWHFTGAPKPWHAATWPWDEHFNWAYRETERVLVGLDVPDPQPTAAQLEAGLAHRRRAHTRLRWVYPWRRLTQRSMILRLLADEPRLGNTAQRAA